MLITATDRAINVVEAMAARRSGTLTVTIGTGCCESTAPFLYEDFWPGPDQELVGQVAGIDVFAPDYLRRQYPGEDGMVLDVVTELADSLSIETEIGCRFVLRGPGFDSSTEPEACPTPEPTGSEGQQRELRPVIGQLPEGLRSLRMR